ncbi:uncharacterized protein J4E88_008348 [Alternaria novae-zelandiae]|uniref:uncharacterized protein n=1 Tax=Alternaria novae-zelandiae TaxID=430562 RepID=UPI0020C26DB7|nr:uncharacterized protein J4E88_008348 [Alternaria novae-zelandiae]KAI4674611.1 hypothetical protein J4E88_008348 [Alternaria novae-zelandiae]
MAEYVRVAKDFGQDFETHRIRLHLSEIRLSHWGSVVGITDMDAETPLRCSPEEQEVAQRTLKQIIKLFQVTEEKAKGLERRSSEPELSDRMRKLCDKMNKLALGRTNKASKAKDGLYAKTKWALFSREGFVNLVESITSLVTDLVSAFPDGIREKRERLCDEDAAELVANEPELSTLLKDALGKDDEQMQGALQKAVAATHQNTATFSGSDVKPTKHSLQLVPIRSLVQVAASEPRRVPITTLRRSITFSTPAAFKLYEPITAAARTTRDNSVANMPETSVRRVDPHKLGKITFKKSEDLIDEWDIEYDGTEGEANAGTLKQAAEELVNTNTPVAFPTETVYGLGADATRSAAVKEIFASKGRPADNPLIVHIHSLPQLRALLLGKLDVVGDGKDAGKDPIPDIYRPVIERFWPGPLTIILPAPENSILAPEVTAGLPTFGARMPRSIIALSLLRLCGRPLAAPSANASTRPSPTAAEHVYDDLNGKLNLIIDGGPCEVGVESTVIDGLSSPPAILRPGGITVEQLRQCPGWENVVVGYKDKQAEDSSKPRAPGMKYRHYSPKASVLLFEAGANQPTSDELKSKRRIGVIRTRSWDKVLGLGAEKVKTSDANGPGICASPDTAASLDANDSPSRLSNLLRSVTQHQIPHADHYIVKPEAVQVWEINLGAKTEDVARGLFSALRELDKKGVEVIYVEGIDDKTGDDIAAAVMNRLRKAAEIRI